MYNVFFYFESISYVFNRLSDKKVRISKIILDFFFKSNSYVFYYFKSNSHVLYCISDERKMISKIIVEILCKRISSVFFYFEFDFLCIILFQGALDRFNIIPQLFPKKLGFFLPLEVLACVMTACQVLRSRLTHFWRYMNISSIFSFSKSTSINTQYSSLRDTLQMMLFTKYLIKWKCVGRISWNFRY